MLVNQRASLDGVGPPGISEETNAGHRDHHPYVDLFQEEGSCFVVSKKTTMYEVHHISKVRIGAMSLYAQQETLGCLAAVSERSIETPMRMHFATAINLQ